jgi:hypothetical protein
MEPKTMERAAQMFPKLTAAQIQRISTIGRRREVRAGELLFDVGDQNTGFFVASRVQSTSCARSATGKNP